METFCRSQLSYYVIFMKTQVAAMCWAFTRGGNDQLQTTTSSATYSNTLPSQTAHWHTHRHIETRKSSSSLTSYLLSTFQHFNQANHQELARPRSSIMSVPTSSSVRESAVIEAPLAQVWHHIKLNDFPAFWQKLSKSEVVKGASPETDIVKWTFKDGTVLEVKQEEHSVCPSTIFFLGALITF